MQNIYFKIGQPNTGKSHGFKKDSLKKEDSFKNFKDFPYRVIPVSGGIGNEYKGLQNTDLALSYDPINKVVRFGEFLQVLMSAILKPTLPHVVFLDDFHNQDISSLLSEYTPLFKGQQKIDLTVHNDFIETMAINIELTKIEDFETADKFIIVWNQFIDTLVKEAEQKNFQSLTPIPVTNRISGSALKLIFPANFYLFAAANFNEKTLNIFADWNDRAELEIIDPIQIQEEAFKIIEDEEKTIVTLNNQELDESESSFIQCCLIMNEKLKNILHKENIFDHEKYCFGIWKVINEKGEIISGKDEKETIENRVKVIKFFFSMIKNSLIYNNRNSHINAIGWALILEMKDVHWFKVNVLREFDFVNIEEYETTDIELEGKATKIFKLLHSLHIYDN